MTTKFLATVAASLPSSRANACDFSDGSCRNPPTACNSTCCLSSSNSKTQTCGCLTANAHGDNICSDPKRMQVIVESCPPDSPDNQHLVNVEVANVPLDTPCKSGTVRKTTITTDGKLKVEYTTVYCFRQQSSLRVQHKMKDIVQVMITSSGFFSVDIAHCTRNVKS